MKPEVKERIYVLIIIFCVFMCSAMVITMLTGETRPEGETHIPVSRPIEDIEATDSATENVDGKNASYSSDTAEIQNAGKNDNIIQTDGQIAVTDEFINEQWGRFLPSNFPVTDPLVDIDADGIITVSGTVSKKALKKYLKEIGFKLGFKYSVALLLLPEKFSVRASLSVKEGNEGKLEVSPYSLYFSGKKIPVAIFPQKISDILSDAVNGVVSSLGSILKFSGFEDGALIFQIA